MFFKQLIKMNKFKAVYIKLDVSMKLKVQNPLFLHHEMSINVLTKHKRVGHVYMKSTVDR